jgi:hypothetical protein
MQFEEERAVIEVAMEVLADCVFPLFGVFFFPHFYIIVKVLLEGLLYNLALLF